MDEHHEYSPEVLITRLIQKRYKTKLQSEKAMEFVRKSPCTLCKLEEVCSREAAYKCPFYRELKRKEY